MKNKHPYTYELSVEQFTLLCKINKESEIQKLVHLAEMRPGNKHRIRLSADEVEKLRGHLTEVLAQTGFGSDYQITPEGSMLEDLIDLLYVKNAQN